MMNDDTTYPHFVPLMWQGDGSNPSPNYSGRGNMYGVGGIPHAQWGGNQQVVGGSPTIINQYTAKYNSIAGNPSPIEIDMAFESNGQGELLVSANVEMSGNITTTNNKILFLLNYDFSPYQTPDYTSSVVAYTDQTFDLTSSGQTGEFEATFTFNPDWEVPQLNAIVIVQTFSGNHEIHQAAISGFTGMYPMFTTNINQGPPCLGV